MTTCPGRPSDHDDRDAESGSGAGRPARWRSDRDYSADWTESQFVDNWRAQDDHETGERTPPMCSICGLFIRVPPPPAPRRPTSSPDRAEDERQEGGRDLDDDHDQDDDDDSCQEEDADHDMDDSFHTNRFDGIADDRPESDNGREDSEEDEEEEHDEDNHDDDDDDDDNEDGAVLTPADVLQFFMSHHQSSVLLPGDFDDDLDDVRAFERHREAVERHIIEAHGAPADYSLDPKDFLPPRPNPSIYVSFTVPLAKAEAAVRTPDEIFDEVSDRFPDLKVGAVPRKTMHGWARVLARGLGRETRTLQGTLSELLHMCYELHWRKANATPSPP